jgi:ribosomal protein S18 acetylase RimI-like enzyme
MDSLEDRSLRKKRNGIEVREMEIDDLATVFHLGEKIFTSQEVPNLYRTWDDYEVIGFFQEDAEYCLVAEADDKIIGFALGTTITKTRSAWKYGHLVWLGVDPEYQRLGVARKLFNHFRELMEEDGVRILVVDTEADNHGAIHFFKSIGFNSPEEHIYLSMNMEQKKKRRRPRKDESE